MREHGTLAETPKDIPDVRFALPSTINWMRALAILLKEVDFSFSTAVRAYGAVQRRSMPDRDLNTVCEQMLFALHQLASLRSIAKVDNKADVARIGIMAWYYGVYGAASAMIAAGDGSFSDTHAATAQHWDRQFAANGLALQPFGDRLSSLRADVVSQELTPVRARGQHSLTVAPVDPVQAWGCHAEYLAGTAKWEQWNNPDIRATIWLSRIPPFDDASAATNVCHDRTSDLTSNRKIGRAVHTVTRLSGIATTERTVTTVHHNYHDRMKRALDHIDRHLDDQLDLEAVSAVAAFSKFHFHRQFSAIFGLSVHRYVQLSRMKRASFRLAYRDDQTVTQIALDAGYDAPDAFARAFQKWYGQSPSSFRKSPDWEPWLAACGPLTNARSKLMQRTFDARDVTIQEVLPTPVAIMEHRGPPAKVGETIKRFIAWRKANGLSPRTSKTFNVFHSDPRTTGPSDYRLDLCAGTERVFSESDQGVVTGVIPGGRCAILRIVGNADDLEPATLYLYRDWLPESGEEARDFPIYCQRISFFPDVPEHEAVADLFLPLK